METNNEEELKKLLEMLLSEISEEEGDEFENLMGISFDELQNDFIKEQQTKVIKIKKLSPDVKTPTYAFEFDSGFDLYSTEKIIIPPFGRTLVPTGLSVEIPEGYEIQVRPKSGLAINMGITVLNTPGTVDKGYSGEIKAIVFNTNNNSVIIEKGMKVAQAVLCPVVHGKYVRFEDVDELGDTERGEGGFGSTGI